MPMRTAVYRVSPIARRDSKSPVRESISVVDTLGNLDVKVRRARRKLRRAKRTLSDHYLFVRRPVQYAVLAVMVVAVLLSAYVVMWPHG